MPTFPHCLRCQTCVWSYMSDAELKEALFAAELHIRTNTMLSDDAVRLIAKALLFLDSGDPLPKPAKTNGTP